jgi:hypothetical protein
MSLKYALKSSFVVKYKIIDFNFQIYTSYSLDVLVLKAFLPWVFIL